MAARPDRSAGVGYATAVWSLGYAVMGAVWVFGGPGFPFGGKADPQGAVVSILGGAQQASASPVIVVLGLVGAVIAVLMTRFRLPAAVGTAAMAFGWTVATVLAVLIPDYRALMRVGYTPIILVGLPFGWPDDVTLAETFPWPVVNQFVLIIGGLLWAACTAAYLRRSRGTHCDDCGHAGAATGWTTPAAAARWGRWAVAVAVVIPCLYAMTRWAWALGIPLGVSREFLASGEPGLWLAGAALGTLGVGGAVLTLGLVQRWGEIYPRWIPFLRGKPVRPRTAIVPATLVAVLVTSAGLMFVRGIIFGGMFDGGLAENITTVGPELFWPVWGIALGAAALAYHLRRREQCTCE